jgi:hypothetical protein
MIDPLKKPTGSRWHRSWRKYAEFLRKNGRRPELGHYKEKSLYTWYNSNLSKSDNGQLDQDQELSFSKLTDNGETYQIYVANRKKSLSKLAFFGRNTNLIRKETDGGGRINFEAACKMYIDFCNRMERHPRLEIKEELNISKWYLKTKDDFFNSRLTDQEIHAFDQLLQSTKQYKNDNVINHVPDLHESNLDKEGKNEVLNANDGTGSHMGARERNWYVMRDRYSKYLDDNKKVPTDNSDLQLYQWLLRQRKLLAAGSLKESRKAELDKLLLKIDDIRRNYSPKPNGGGRKRKKPTGDDLESSSLSKSKQNHVKQDDLWNQKWQAYKDFMVKNKRRPSKHRAENLVLFDWFKHSKRLLKRGLMKAERITKFKQLLSEAENLPRFNQFNYVDTSLKS